MILLDSNIFIYLSKGTLDNRSISEDVIAHSSISEIEVLGYQHITANELILLRNLFDQSVHLPISENVLQTAIKLRQVKSMSLGDSIIAATAITNEVPVWTANDKDFAHIQGLEVFNPLK